MRQRHLLAIVLVAGCAVAAAMALLLSRGEEIAGRSVEIFIGDVRLAIPKDYLRFEDARAGGRLPQADLAVDVRTFRPAKLARKFRPDGPDPNAQQLFLTLSPPQGNLAPSDRTARLYARFLNTDNWSHPGGLIMHRFRDGSPFAHEDLYFAPPEGRLFAARCRRPPKTPDGLPNTCLAEFRFDGIDVRARFSPDLLADWDRLTASIRGLLQSFRQ